MMGRLAPEEELGISLVKLFQHDTSEPERLAVAETIWSSERHRLHIPDARLGKLRNTGTFNVWLNGCNEKYQQCDQTKHRPYPDILGLSKASLQYLRTS